MEGTGGFAASVSLLEAVAPRHGDARRPRVPVASPGAPSTSPLAVARPRQPMRTGVQHGGPLGAVGVAARHEVRGDLQGALPRPLRLVVPPPVAHRLRVRVEPRRVPSHLGEVGDPVGGRVPPFGLSAAKPCHGS